jgi:hypothetical protein
VAVFAALLVAALAGVAWATSSSNSAVIHGCYKKSTGTLRVITRGKKGQAGKCRKTEKALSWNQHEVAGPRGPQGGTGPRGGTGNTGPQGPGAVEYSYSLLDTSPTQTLGPAGPFQLSASCTTGSGEVANRLLETNVATVMLDETTISSGLPPTQINPGVSIPPSSTPTQLEIIASPSSAQRHSDSTITAPSDQLGQLIDTIASFSNGCTGSVVWIPASP